MAPPKIMSGQRALLQIVDPNTNQAKTLGIFNNCSYGWAYSTQDAPILGRSTVAAIEYTGAEPTNISASSWRVLNHGPHVETGMPKLSDLLTSDYLVFQIVDRETQQVTAKFRKVRCTSYSSQLTAKQLEEMTHTFRGILVDDEDTENDERPDAADLP